MNERVLLIPCAGEHLVGVLAVPDAPADTAVLVIVGGPQYRAGSHRQFVQLARHLAAGGYPVLRFDVRGMGDSEGAPRRFDAISEDVAAALQALRHEVPTLRRVVLWGLCDGASAALLYLHDCNDPLVQGLVLLNPWVRSEQSLARTYVKHYYRQRLLQREFWAKLFSGRVAVQAVGELVRNVGRSVASVDVPTAGFQERMARAWAAFPGPILMVLSGNDYTAQEFLEHTRASTAWSTLLTHPKVSLLELQRADHTFAEPDSNLAVMAATLRWLREAASRDAPAKDIAHA
jgi:exosortase A-associated hydrolase 1